MFLLSILVTFTLAFPTTLTVDGGTPSTAAQYRSAIVASTQQFELRSDPRITLHHFLIAWASADAGEWPRYAPTVAERQTWRLLLDGSERQNWSTALEAYKSAVGRSYVFDAGLVAVRDWAAGVATRGAIPAADQRLADALEAALPIYRRHWWPAHDARNRAWIEAVTPPLAAMEGSVVPRLEAAYGGRWPDAKISVDAVVYANDVGAYSTGGRVTIASGDPDSDHMPQALELVFHEASHVDPLEGSLRAGLTDAFRAVGGAAPERFWHDVIFYTTGEATRLVLAEHGQPGYKHYGEYGVYRRGERWSVELPALERHWRPFLESASNDPHARRAALEDLARQLLAAEDSGSS
jgi:hypothetical protein